MATHDPLTGLPNWALFNDRLTLALARAQRNQQKLAVMLLDLDQFKKVNDTLVECADIAMYQAKAKGRNHYQCYSSKYKPRCFRADS